MYVIGLGRGECQSKQATIQRSYCLEYARQPYSNTHPTSQAINRNFSHPARTHKLQPLLRPTNTAPTTSTTAMDPVTMPRTLSSYHSPPSQTTPTPTSTTQPSYTGTRLWILLQHSTSATAGSSALLPHSNIIGVYATLNAALTRLRQLKDQAKPLVRCQGVQPRPRPQFSNTGCITDIEWDDESGEGVCGYRYTAASEDEFEVWVEGHDVQA